MVQFWQIQPSLVARAVDRDMSNLHQSSIWVREDKDHA
jgi:hypothetical protein